MERFILSTFELSPEFEYDINCHPPVTSCLVTTWFSTKVLLIQSHYGELTSTVSARCYMFSHDASVSNGSHWHAMKALDRACLPMSRVFGVEHSDVHDVAG